MDRSPAAHATESERLFGMLSSILRNQEKMIKDARTKDRQHLRIVDDFDWSNVEQERRDRRKQLFEERVFSELNDLRGRLRALDATSPATFPQFQRLPKEIKQMIWALTIPRRAHKIIRNDTDDTDGIDDEDYHFAKNIFKAPAITQVCKESRAVALRYGQYFSPSTVHDKKIRTCWPWFSPELDIMILTRGATSACGNICTAIKRIFLEFGQRRDESPLGQPVTIMGSNFYGKGYNPRETMPSLEAAYVGYRLNIGCEVGPSIMREFFGDDEVLLVDVEETVAVSRVMRLLEQTRGKRSKYIGNRGSRREAATMKRFTKDYEKALPMLRTQVLAAAGGASEAHLDWRNEDGRPNTALDWVRETLESCKFRPGMLFVRDPCIHGCPGHHGVV